MATKRQPDRASDSVDIRGILFDKDGTILDFYSYWVPFLHQLLREMAEKCAPDNPEPIRRSSYEALGLDWETGQPGPEIFMITPRHIGFRLVKVMFRHGMHLVPVMRTASWLRRRSSEIQRETEHRIKPIGRLVELMEALKARDIRIGLVTIDRKHSAHHSVKRLGIEEYVDFIATSDGEFKKKPAPDAMNVFCKKYGLEPSEVAVVGDAVLDMRFARRANSGYAVAVLTGSGDRRALGRMADRVYDSIDDLLDDTRIFP